MPPDLISVRIHGIPATIQLHSYLKVPPCLSADNPDDYYGYEEADYTILDRRGYPAPWLEKLATDTDRDAIMEAIRSAQSSNFSEEPDHE